MVFHKRGVTTRDRPRIIILYATILFVTGCATTKNTDHLTYNKVDYYNTVMEWNQKHTCYTQAGKSCWGFNERDCTLNYNRYKLYCQTEWYDKYPDILNQKQAIDLHVNMAACISTMRYNDIYRRDQINQASCKYLHARENLDALLKEAEQRDVEIKSTWIKKE